MTPEERERIVASLEQLAKLIDLFGTRLSVIADQISAQLAELNKEKI